MSEFQCRDRLLEARPDPEDSQMNRDDMASSMTQPNIDGFDELFYQPPPQNWIDDTWLIPPFTCNCHGLGFAKRADLTRHLAKEERRFECTVPHCASTTTDGLPPCFGTLNDKKRHYRDVHGTDLSGHPVGRFYCPWEYCKRHSEGFPRAKNLENHIKSIHEGQRPPTDTAAPVAVNTDAPVGHSGATSSAPLPAPTATHTDQQFSQTRPASQLSQSIQASQPSQPTHLPASLLQVPSITTTSGAAIQTESPTTLTPEEAADVLCQDYEREHSGIQQAIAEQKSHLAAVETQLNELENQYNSQMNELRNECSTLKDSIRANKVVGETLCSRLRERRRVIREQRDRRAANR